MASSKQKVKRKQELNDIRTVLGTKSGRRLVWRLMEHCKVFGKVYDDSPTKTAYYCGQTEIGKFIMSEVIDTDENLLFKLMSENMKKDKVEED